MVGQLVLGAEWCRQCPLAQGLAVLALNLAVNERFLNSAQGANKDKSNPTSSCCVVGDRSLIYRAVREMGHQVMLVAPLWEGITHQ